MLTRFRSLKLASAARLLIVAALIAGAVLPVVTREANAQDTSRMPMYQIARVTVLGHGSVTVKPDIASVSLGVSVTKPELSQAQSEAANVMTDILAAVRAAGVADDDIQTSYYNVYPLTKYDETGTPTGISGYQVSNQVQVTVRDLDTVTSLLEDAVSAGANSIYGVTFGISDASAAESEARAEAVADARTRAEELATAAGLRLGNIVSMNEGVFDGTVVYPYQSGGQGAGGPVEIGSLTVTSNVQVTYELVS